MSIVYVAGFVDVVNYPKSDKSLLLKPEQVARCLPINNPIPLNIEHLCEAEVGWTLGLIQVDFGLFCFGVITSVNFLNLLEKLFINSSVAQTRDKKVPPEPKLEMLHTWLPELSLSSMHPDFISENADTSQTFQHVALCAMGRRRGTIAVYGPELAWILSKFTSLNKYEKDNIIKLHNSIDMSKLDMPNFSIQPEALMAKAIDAGFIKHRLDILKTDKGVADIKNALYLKASIQEPVTQFSGDPEDGSEATDEAAKQPALDTDMNPSGSQSMGHQPEELISVPKSTFMTMLQTNIDSVKQTTPKQPVHFQNEFSHLQHQTPYPMMGNIYYPHPPPPSTPMMPYIKPGSYQPDFHVVHQNTPPNAWMGKYPIDEGCGHFSWGQYIPAAYPSRPGKRKRDSDIFDGPVFPGEETSLYRDFANITKNISEIQNEIKDLKNVAMGQRPEFVPTAPNWLYVQPNPGQVSGYPAMSQPSMVAPLMATPQFNHQMPHPSFNAQVPMQDSQVQTPAQYQLIQTQETTVPPPVPQKIPQPTPFTGTQPTQGTQIQPASTQQADPSHQQPSKEPHKHKNDPKIPCVNASSKRDSASQLQKMFCEELLNKQ